MKTMLHHIRPIVTLLGAFTVLLGGVYPAVVTYGSKALFHDKAEGSLIVVNGQPVGSRLIGQPFTDARYFWPRPSATAPFPYNPMASAGSNFSPANPALKERIAARAKELRESSGNPALAIPAELLTTSASGLDPHLSIPAARYQIPRIAKARGMSEESVANLLDRLTESRTMGIFGEPRVNVLVLNLALDGKVRE